MNQKLRIELYRGLIEDKEGLWFDMIRLKNFIILDSRVSDMLSEFCDSKCTAPPRKRMYFGKYYSLYPITIWHFLREVTFDSGYTGFFFFRDKKIKFHIVQSFPGDRTKNWYMAIY